MDQPGRPRRRFAAFKRETSHAPHGSFAALTVGALGVVYGDIGTSPLYAMDRSFFGRPHRDPIQLNWIMDRHNRPI
jgi:K+ transporter